MIVSFSGGKDSTAMLHWLIERGEDIEAVVWFDTGWEFPEMAAHVDQVERQTGLPVTRLTPKLPFDYELTAKPVAKRGTAAVHRHGLGWPNALRRWCTGRKMDVIRTFAKGHSGPMCMGFAADEQARTLRADGGVPRRYPLIEAGMTEADALAYCKRLGYHWRGLYDLFPRVSCYCCPLQSLQELRTLRHRRPGLWATMREKGQQIRHPLGQRFHHEATLEDLEVRFANEDRQGVLAFAAADEPVPEPGQYGKGDA